MDTKTVGTPGNQSLADFQTVVQQQEGIFGPLNALGRQDPNNIITLEIGESPVKRALLEIYEGDKPPTKAGHKLICNGECLVKSQPAKVAAYRPI